MSERKLVSQTAAVYYEQNLENTREFIALSKYFTSDARSLTWLLRARVGLAFGGYQRAKDPFSGMPELYANKCIACRDATKDTVAHLVLECRAYVGPRKRFLYPLWERAGGERASLLTGNQKLFIALAGMRDSREDCCVSGRLNVKARKIRGWLPKTGQRPPPGDSALTQPVRIARDADIGGAEAIAPGAAFRRGPPVTVDSKETKAIIASLPGCILAARGVGAILDWHRRLVEVAMLRGKRAAAAQMKLEADELQLRTLDLAARDKAAKLKVDSALSFAQTRAAEYNALINQVSGSAAAPVNSGGAASSAVRKVAAGRAAATDARTERARARAAANDRRVAAAESARASRQQELVAVPAEPQAALGAANAASVGFSAVGAFAPVVPQLDAQSRAALAEAIRQHSLASAQLKEAEEDLSRVKADLKVLAANKASHEARKAASARRSQGDANQGVAVTSDDNVQQAVEAVAGDSAPPALVPVP